jgi:uncharacterized protein YkwD
MKIKKRVVNSENIVSKLVGILLTVFIILIFGLVIKDSNIILGSKAKQTPAPTIDISNISVPESPTPTSTIIPTRQPERQYNPTPTIPWGKEVKLDNNTSASRFAPDDHMSTVSELNQAMNNYRQNLGLPMLNFDTVLCNIAQQRANELQALGKLDNHAGFSDFAHNQQSFNSIAEVLFGGVEQVSGVHIVEWGWAQSLTGHKEAIDDPNWHDGCAGIAGYFAVFEFGSR